MFPINFFSIVLFLLFTCNTDTQSPNPNLDNKSLEHVSHYVAEGLKEGIAGGVAGGLKEGIPATINAGAEALKNQFEPTGDGHKAVNNIFKSVGNQFDAQGEGHQTLQKIFTSVGDEFAEGSQGRRMALNTADTTSLYINNVGTTFGSVVTKMVAKNALITVVGSLGVATMWYGSKVLWHYIERQLQKPRIIIESYHKNFLQRIQELFGSRKKQVSQQQSFIFEQELQERLEAIIQTTKIIHQKIKLGKKNIKYRNLLLYGPPGTGKTLFAKQLAHQCGMEFAMASGASFGKKGALEAIDELFTWAHKSKGLLLFIDEAESLMPNREGLDPDSDSYRVFTNFLNYTGTRSNKVMIVMATNRLNIIDEAMYRRIDDLVELPLPGTSARAGVLRAYRDKILLDLKNNDAEFVLKAQEILHDAKIETIAIATQGLSNGDLEGIINMIKTDADSTQDCLVTETIVDTAVKRMMQKYTTFTSLKTIPSNDQAEHQIQSTYTIVRFFCWLLKIVGMFWAAILGHITASTLL
jgi:ATP-dependent 26S proteasome regulatory subunit